MIALVWHLNCQFNVCEHTEGGEYAGVWTQICCYGTEMITSLYFYKKNDGTVKTVSQTLISRAQQSAVMTVWLFLKEALNEYKEVKQPLEHGSNVKETPIGKLLFSVGSVKWKQVVKIVRLF